MVRCRPGIVMHAAFETIPDQRRIAAALRRVRETSPRKSRRQVPSSTRENHRKSATGLTFG
jgi:hypothetical protein